ncbi:MAG: hypothetical protein M1818_003508 [Claussenomyces sp. TS43310]|nr:MAG: hypothetical protein M1818_003508 [Claussenomyces sp. TS43310]
MASRDLVIPLLSRDLLVKCGPRHSKDSSGEDDVLLNKELFPVVSCPNGQSDKCQPDTLSCEFIELREILDSFANSPRALRQQYGNDLKDSLTALQNVRSQPKPEEVPLHVDDITGHIQKAWMAVHDHLARIREALSTGDDRLQWLLLGGLWPGTPPSTILEQLRSSSAHYFGEGMKESIVHYGILITTLQQLLRIKHAQLKKDQHKLLEELRSKGHTNWRPLDHPDWLLIEIDSNILIRSEQVEVAHAIISPASGYNSVLQMNMGKGKTSCIVPMAVAILANKKQLSRLIVPKTLLLQTAQTIQSRIGGLVGREVKHIPFSRRTSTTPGMLQLYSDLHRESLSRSGVLLTIPEHILSYKLSGLQRLADSRLEEARVMVRFQSWLTDVSRDVLDESDFTLAVKTQLIYPSGPQISVDGHPHRWKVAQMLLSLVEDHLSDLNQRFRQSIEVVKRPRGFPMVHFLQIDVENALHHLLISDICEGHTSILRLSDPSSSVDKNAFERLLSEERLDQDNLERISQRFIDKSSASKKILLIRGMLVNEILLLCLKKKWNVQYGLHPDRHPIAVPFEAKGVPSEQAEFGHPDVAILLTCLAFYYSGLTMSQFREGLQRVLMSDDPAAEYDRWIHRSDTLPETLLHWNIINVEDEGQLEELWRHLRFNKSVLDHYMNTFVFPVHAKQFGVKLQASGWDLPLFPESQAEGNGVCRARTTGFSGTNDNKMMLPLTIKQDDLPSLHQTNAEVLTYLLQDRNRQYNLAADPPGSRRAEEGLLRKLEQKKIRIFIDAGAYILEMRNEDVVKAWLDIDTQAQGAVYFGTDNRAWVQYRGIKAAVPLVATPFAENFDQCLVYLDQAHTRGTDLKLPRHARGALTIGLGQTKDHTVQAAMRLRQLETTQSIAFFAPPAVHQSIMDVCNMGFEQPINSSHVIFWLLEQTCRANEQLQDLYLAQGIDFCRRMNAEWKNVGFLSDKGQRAGFLRVIQHPELQTLEQMYGNVADTKSISPTEMSCPQLKTFLENLVERRKEPKGYGATIHSSAMEEVEQEREVEFQVEEVRQVQKPMHYNALAFPGLHEAVSHFARTGELTGVNGYEDAFVALARTKLGQKYGMRGTTSGLFVSDEFMRAVAIGKRDPIDSFLRPVEWMLWSPSTEIGLIIIPEEAELLIPRIRAAMPARVHLISYAAPVTRNMLHFNKLSYYVLPQLPDGYSVPEWLSMELGILAGRLYIDFAECAPLARFLKSADKGSAEVSYENGCRIGVRTMSPLSFLLEWLTLRRKGQDIMHTPMGYICQDRTLHEKHAFFLKRRAVAGEPATPSIGRNRKNGQEDIEDGDSEAEDEFDPMDLSRDYIE